MKWYVGSRTAKNCHLNDGYITSSKIVKAMIQNSPDEWERTILFVGDKQEIRNLETEVLELFDAKQDCHSFNLHNQNGKFVCTGHSEETIEKIKNAIPWAGKKRPEHSEKMKGKKRKPEHIEKWASAMRGRPFTESHKQALKHSMRKTQYLTPFGVFESSREAAEHTKLPRSTVLYYCKSKNHPDWEMKGLYGNV
jgi:hypothetical protein